MLISSHPFFCVWAVFSFGTTWRHCLKQIWLKWATHQYDPAENIVLRIETWKCYSKVWYVNSGIFLPIFQTSSPAEDVWKSHESQQPGSLLSCGIFVSLILSLLGKQWERTFWKTIQNVRVCHKLLVRFGRVQDIVAEFAAELAQLLLYFVEALFLLSL